MKRVYTDEVKAFIAEHVKGMSTKDLTELVNNKFNLGMTESKMKSYKKNHKLCSGVQTGNRKGSCSKQFPWHVKQYIEENYKGTGHAKMAALLNAEYGTGYTAEQIKGYYKNHGLNCGLTGRFNKGHVPVNKGVKGAGGWEPTQFKKGHLPANYLPVGTERVNTLGYTDIKIADPNKWKAKHKIIWEEVNGEIPEGHVLIFADGDKQNIRQENLLLVSMGQLAVLNRFGLIQQDAEATKVGVTVASVQLKINQRKRGSGK